eukprot:CAMPEP_0173130480 /NCGR_PEP_ID=MMETSP1102-20130122/60032_1 /TAXON_ID=49646 /ORGANISM="Geminigera sp., Strain Caron Lab Isolate" /LENGTH=146 /DNA_ID=CAMNT_0014041537 /DNA_START=60 /DNA_END=497 /DNA_ORIENTATION=+
MRLLTFTAAAAWRCEILFLFDCDAPPFPIPPCTAQELTSQLRRVADKENVQKMSHLLFYGPSGAGKKTRIMALLREIYGPGVEKLKVDVRPFKFKSSEVEVTFLSSNYHVELNPSDVGPYKDRDVAQEVIKEIAQSHAPSTAAGGL